jgi:hypothetical protein
LLFVRMALNTLGGIRGVSQGAQDVERLARPQPARRGTENSGLRMGHWPDAFIALRCFPK